MKLSHAWSHGAAVFDDENLESGAGLVPVMELAEQTGLSDLLDKHVVFRSEPIRSGAANPTPKLTSVIAGLLTGADSIDDLNMIRAGGMKRLFGDVYAPATLGILLREFTGGHVRQLHVGAPPTPAGADPADRRVGRHHHHQSVRGHRLAAPPGVRARKQGASFGHTKIANRQVLRKGLSPLATTISTPTAAPVLAGIRLRAGKAGSGKGAASMVTEAINTAKAAGATNILVRGDSAYGNGKVIAAVVKAGARFSFTLAKAPSVNRAIGLIDDAAWTPVHYPGAVTDPDTGESISDAEVAEIEYTAFKDSPEEITARLIVRRVKDRNHPDELFPVWRYHPFFTDNTEPVTDADVTHRQHAIIESVFADLIDGPLAHLPSGLFPANSAWTVLAAITHNLLRAAGTLSGKAHAVARGATLRRHLVNVPARIARPQGKRTLHLPVHWPRARDWNMLWDSVFTGRTRQVTA